MKTYGFEDWLAFNGSTRDDMIWLLGARQANARLLDSNVVASEKSSLSCKAIIGPCADAFSEHIPHLRPHLERMRQSIEVVETSGPGRPATIPPEGDGVLRILIPAASWAQKALWVSHEFGHALQLTLLERKAVPPILREIAAFVGEHVFLAHLRHHRPDLYPTLAVVHASSRQGDLGKGRRALLGAIQSGDGTYRYDWNYPPARILADKLARDNDTDALLAVFRGETGLSTLIRQIRQDAPEVMSGREAWQVVVDTLRDAFPDQLDALDRQIDRIALQMVDGVGPWTATAIDRGRGCAPILRCAFGGDVPALLDLARAVGEALVLANPERAALARGDVELGGAIVWHLLARRSARADNQTCAETKDGPQPKTPALMTGAARDQIALPLPSDPSEQEIGTLAKQLVACLAPDTLWPIVAGNVSGLLLLSQSDVRHRSCHAATFGRAPGEVPSVGAMRVGVAAVEWLQLRRDPVTLGAFADRHDRVGNPPMSPPSGNMVESLGAAILGLAISPYHRDFDLYRYLRVHVLPALALGQMRTWFEADGSVAGFVTWARVTEETEASLHRTGRPLRGPEWASGARVFINDLVATPAAFQTIFSEMTGALFRNERVSSLRRNPDGTVRRVNRWRGDGLRRASQGDADPGARAPIAKKPSSAKRRDDRIRGGSVAPTISHRHMPAE